MATSGADDRWWPAAAALDQPAVSQRGAHVVPRRRCCPEQGQGTRVRRPISIAQSQRSPASTDLPDISPWRWLWLAQNHRRGRARGVRQRHGLPRRGRHRAGRPALRTQRRARAASAGLARPGADRTREGRRGVRWPALPRLRKASPRKWRL